IRCFSAGTTANISEPPNPSRNRSAFGGTPARARQASVNPERYLTEARLAAQDLRAAGRPVLPLAEAFHLDPATERLLRALLGLRILAPDEMPALSPSTTAAA